MVENIFPHAYTEFQPLEEVMVGKSYSPKNLDWLPEKMSKVTKRLLSYLLDETEEDYQNFIKVIEQYGAKVYRPNYGNISCMTECPYLMYPRDTQIVLDNKIIFANSAKVTTQDFAKPLSHYAEYFLMNKKLNNLIGSAIIRLGKTIIVDSNEGANPYEHYSYLKDLLAPLGYNVIYYQTHNFKFETQTCHADGCFAILKPGVLLTLKPKYMYTEGLFPNWDTCTIQNEGSKINSWRHFRKTHKNLNSSYRFNDEKYKEKEFYEVINTWLSDWVGYAKETVFDINVFSLDEQHVCVSNYNKKVFDYFKKYKIEPIIVPFRHRYFWDGGLHCISLDIKRRGSLETYL